LSTKKDKLISPFQLVQKKKGIKVIDKCQSLDDIHNLSVNSDEITMHSKDFLDRDSSCVVPKIDLDKINEILETQINIKVEEIEPEQDHVRRFRQYLKKSYILREP
jgi:hypothetical protein